MRFLFAMVLGVVVACVVGIGLGYAGVYDVAASRPENPALAWFFSTVSDHSIAARATTAVHEPRLDDPALVQTGFAHYDAMCVTCHGGPGLAPSEIRQGLNPGAPDLASDDVQKSWSDAELYWIVDHGIRRSGMPAFGETHDARDIWAIVAFVRHLPGMSGADYQHMRATVGAAPGRREGGQASAG
jgi:mono/diheme cytochrome c family protein